METPPTASRTPRVRWSVVSGIIALVAIAGFVSARWATSKPVDVAPDDSSFPSTVVKEPVRPLPLLGDVLIGAYAGEAAQTAGLGWSSTVAFADPVVYARYRASVEATYGRQLEDMNYFAVGTEGWEDRITYLQAWMVQAAEYGDVTVALEPLGSMEFDVFEPGPAMDRLAKAFEAVAAKDRLVYVRFGSEANLRGSEYSVLGKGSSFYDKAVWFKAAMPDNVRMVFSPLINTVVWKDSLQVRTVKGMLLGKTGQIEADFPWDRIGGTIYRTDRPLEPMFQTYIDMILPLVPHREWQLCELGGPYGRHEEMIDFLKLIESGRWPMLKKVNLFARDINTRADPDGHFGFIDPVERTRASTEAKQTGKPVVVESWLKPLLLNESEQ